LKYKNFKTKEMVLCGIFIALLSISAYIRLPIFGVPFTLQTLIVMLIGQFFCKKLCFITVGIYITLGTLGLPIFAGGGGLSYVLYPTYGYILGFLLCSVIISGIRSKTGNSFKFRMIANLLGLIPVYVFGIAHYFLISNVYLKENISLAYILFFGFLIFVPFDILCAFFSSILAKRLEKISNLQQ
jgi:biotin transport system substrate-specific component